MNGGVLTLTGVVVGPNQVAGNGGGLNATASAVTILRRVLFAENQATQLGGGMDVAGVVSAENVTFSSNSASGGGGMSSTASMALNNVTLAQNTASPGPGILVISSQTTVSNSLFSTGGGCAVVGGNMLSFGFNIATDTSCTALTANGDRRGVAVALGALGNNGGETRTHSLLNPATNPAVDGGNPATPLDGASGRCVAVDQRNQARPRDGNGDGNARCDVGAVEIQTTGTFDLKLPNERVSIGNPAPVTFSWTVPEPLVWRDLEWLSLRLLDEKGRIVFWVRWTEADDRFALLDADGNEVASGVNGSNTVLQTAYVSLNLKDVRVDGSGPTGQTVTLFLPLNFADAAADQTFTVQVAARGDDGSEDPFVVAGKIGVGPPAPRGVPDDDSDEDKPGGPERPRRPTEEQREQGQRTNRSGLDDHRTEGNVVALDKDATPPTVTIAARDGLIVLELHGEAKTVTVKVGDYVTATGEKIHEHRYEIESLSIEKP